MYFSKHTPIQGFTLIELLIGTALLLMLFAGSATIFQIALEIVGDARVRTIATHLAEEKIEQFKNLNYADVGTVGGIPNGVIPETEVVDKNGVNFTVQTNVVYIDDPFDGLGGDDPINTDYKRIRLQVFWNGIYDSSEGIAFVSDVSPNGLESNEGGGTLQIGVINASGQPVESASVRIVNTQVIPNIDVTQNTNSLGQIILPGSPACNECYEITVTKSGFSTDQTYSSLDIANPIKPHATVLESDTSSLTFAIDRTSTVTFYTSGSRTSNYPAFAGVQFKMTGTKTLGTDTNDEPILKYNQTLVSGPGGVLNLPNLEWDTYTLSIPNPSSIDFAGSYALSPFSLSPNANITVRIVTQPASPHNLLLKMTTVTGAPIATASATAIHDVLGSIATKSAGLSGKGDFGQALFANLDTGMHTIWVEHPDYKQASISAEVVGDSVAEIVLEPK